MREIDEPVRCQEQTPDTGSTVHLLFLLDARLSQSDSPRHAVPLTALHQMTAALSPQNL
jgi:hypothetical protein